MLTLLKRHPVPIEAHFDYSLVLTFALPGAMLRPMLPPGLTLDSYGDHGFLAIALVQTRALRPRGLPGFMGKDFFLSGYRIFARFETESGQSLRGLRILRSDANSPTMVRFGNLLTHYRYRLAQVSAERTATTLTIAVTTPDAEADLKVCARLDVTPERPPAGSPFPDLETARRYAGPLPYTFDYEEETHSVVMIKGVRKAWDPRPVQVEVERCTFLEGAAFRHGKAVLANAFLVEQVPYHWRRGVRVALPRAPS